MVDESNDIMIEKECDIVTIGFVSMPACNKTKDENI